MPSNFLVNFDNFCKIHLTVGQYRQVVVSRQNNESDVAWARLPSTKQWRQRLSTHWITQYGEEHLSARVDEIGLATECNAWQTSAEIRALGHITHVSVKERICSHRLSPHQLYRVRIYYQKPVTSKFTRPKCPTIPCLEGNYGLWRPITSVIQSRLWNSRKLCRWSVTTDSCHLHCK